MCLAAAEQTGEQLAEMRIEPLECRDETLAGFLIERGDAAPQSGDRLGQLGALAPHFGVPRLDFGRPASRAKIDRADRLAPPRQPIEPCRGVARVAAFVDFCKVL